MASPSTQKFRPVLTANMIEHLLVLAKKDMLSQESISLNRSAELITLLSPFKAKIDNAGVKAAYTTAPKLSLEEQLGFTPISADSAVTQATAQAPYVLDSIPYNSKEAYWEACYIKSQDTRKYLSLVEIKATQEHRYINDLMSTEEMLLFEKAAFGLEE